AKFGIRNELPVWLDEVAPDPHGIGEVSCLWTARNHGVNRAEGTLPGAAEHGVPMYAAQLPAQRGDERHQGVIEAGGVVTVAEKKVEDEGDVVMETSAFEGKIPAMFAEDSPVYIGPRRGDSHLGR